MQGDEPENELEQALAAALNDERGWSSFYRTLRSAQVFVAHVPDPDGPPDVLDANGVPARLRVPTVVAHGETHNTLFTSRERLLRHYGPSCARFQVPAGGIMRLAGRVPYYVNPGSNLSVTLPGDLVAAIADGSIFERPPVRALEGAKLGALRISRPPTPQTHISRALVALFQRRVDVDCAHLAWLTEEGADEPPHAVVGIQTSAPFADVAAACDAALADVVPPHAVVDFVPLDEGAFSKQVRAVDPPFFRRVCHA